MLLHSVGVEDALIGTCPSLDCFAVSIIIVLVDRQERDQEEKFILSSLQLLVLPLLQHGP